jgi:hypothetical protein
MTGCSFRCCQRRKANGFHRRADDGLSLASSHETHAGMSWSTSRYRQYRKNFVTRRIRRFVLATGRRLRIRRVPMRRGGGVLGRRSNTIPGAVYSSQEAALAAACKLGQPNLPAKVASWPFVGGRRTSRQYSSQLRIAHRLPHTLSSLLR